jgi:hypothetical protein
MIEIGGVTIVSLAEIGIVNRRPLPEVDVFAFQLP